MLELILGYRQQLLDWFIAGDPAREVLKDSCQNLMSMCQHVRSLFDESVAEFKKSNPTEMETSM
uniref:Uncharacterized protein MANES_01G166500 n=1 Tax=Rhizophora mucronata TaxID=61149 RepID=A0A2P2JL29_RHIMU